MVLPTILPFTLTFQTISRLTIAIFDRAGQDRGLGSEPCSQISQSFENKYNLAGLNGAKSRETRCSCVREVFLRSKYRKSLARSPGQKWLVLFSNQIYIELLARPPNRVSTKATKRKLLRFRGRLLSSSRLELLQNTPRQFLRYDLT